MEYVLGSSWHDKHVYIYAITPQRSHQANLSDPIGIPRQTVRLLAGTENKQRVLEVEASLVGKL